MKYTAVDLESAKQKVSSTRELILELLEGEFPYSDPQDALKAILSTMDDLEKSLQALDEATADDTVLAYCRQTNSDIVRIMTLLGVVLRSSNLRNSFELVYPLADMCKRLLGSDVKLVLSSEWEFSPLIYPEPLPEIPELIIIGFPASESKNPLTTPLAGHEFGHSLWRRTSLGKTFSLELENTIVDLFADNWSQFEKLFQTGSDKTHLRTDLLLRGFWTASLEISVRQCEEVLCDMLGVRLFGESFLYAFRYMLAPSLGQYRSVFYPNIRARAEYIERAAKHFGHKVGSQFVDSFSEQNWHQGRDLFLLETADKATERTVDAILKATDLECQNRGFDHPTEDKCLKAYHQLLVLSPATSVSGIADIINAGWRLRLNLDSWKLDGVSNVRKTKILYDLVLKSIEIFELELRKSNYDAKRAGTS